MSSDDDPFWTLPVFAIAGVLLLLRAPAILSFPTVGGMVGGVIGGVLAALAVAGVLKAVYVVISRAAARVNPS